MKRHDRYDEDDPKNLKFFMKEFTHAMTCGKLQELLGEADDATEMREILGCRGSPEVI